MNYRSAASVAFEVGVLIVVVSLIAGQFLGVPVLFSFVETGSMAPTMEAGDGFIAVPAEVSGSIESGDVITFQAQALHGGGLTTHRVVAVTENGYITQGDANPATDQDGQEPPVTDGQVVATALQIGDTVVVIPRLGAAVSGIQGAVESVQYALATLLGTDRVLGSGGLTWLLIAAGLFTYAVAIVIDPNTRSRPRDTTRSRRRAHVYNVSIYLLVIALAIGFVTGGTMALMSGTDDIEIRSVGFDSEQPTAMEAGSTDDWNYTMYNSGIIPTTTVVEPASGGVRTDPTSARLERGEAVNVTVSLTAPEEHGRYIRSVRSSHYFAVLPHDTIIAMHAIHPWLARGSVIGVLIMLFTLPSALVLGTGTVRTRERSRESPDGWW